MDDHEVKLVLFAHPSFSPSRSMQKFAQMLADAFAERGLSVEVWSPRAVLRRWVSSARFRKWAEYFDQFVVFPFDVRRRLSAVSDDCLFVFCDQALGPWVPLVKRFPHVIHVHDLLALRSALGDVPENPTGWTGRVYQLFIRAGFRQARHFISVSQKSRSDLHAFGRVKAATSEVVHNGLNDFYTPLALHDALAALQRAGLEAERRGIVLSVGADAWYKNRPGVFRIYEHYVRQQVNPLPMWVVGQSPGSETERDLAIRVAPGTIRFIQHLDSCALRAAYSLARVLLFPSLAEGFGWPIAEAMACGCPVLTTGEAPMTEVGGDAAWYVPRLGYGEDLDAWAFRAAVKLSTILALEGGQRATLVDAGLAQAARFGADRAIEAYLRIYRHVFELERGIGFRAEPLSNKTIAPAEGP